MNTRHLLEVSLATLALSACEAQRLDVAVPDRDALVVADAGVQTLDAGATDGELHADGTWLLFIQDRYCLYAAGAVSDFMVWSWYLVNLSGEGPGAEMNQVYFQETVKLCAQDQSPVTAGLVTYIPAAVTAALPERHLQGFLLGNLPGGRFLSTELSENWGLSDAVGPEDPLPESADDPRVIDQDGDGKVGVTMVIGNNFCTVQIAQRTRYRLSGEVVDSARIEGTLWSDVSKSVFGATLPLCAAENQLDSRPDGNRMVMMRVDGRNGGTNLDADGDGRIDCAEIMAAREHLLEAELVVKDAPNAARCR